MGKFPSKIAPWITRPDPARDVLESSVDYMIESHPSLSSIGRQVYIHPSCESFV
jgi:hypothetical protein